MISFKLNPKNVADILRANTVLSVFLCKNSILYDDFMFFPPL